MMDSAPSGGDGRRRGRKSRGRHGRRTSKRPPSNNNRSRSGNRGQHQPQHEWYAKESNRDDSSVLGGRTVTARTRDRMPQQNDGPPDAFVMFCAYNLGITQDDGYHEPRLDDVARRFGMNRDEVRALLKEFQLDDESVRRSKYDMIGAKMDIRLAPEGISRTESARGLYEEYVEALQSEVA